MTARPSVAERMAARTQKTETCWLWVGNINSQTGYGRLGMDGKNHVAHRVAYELAKGPIPEGLVIDHLCRVRHCVNPDHLEPVTIRENTLRGIGIPAVKARADRCHRGHLYDAENTIIQRGNRLCRTCRDARDLAWALKRRRPKDPNRCKNGHEWTTDNTRIVKRLDGGQHRACRTCHREDMRRRRAAA